MECDQVIRVLAKDKVIFSPRPGWWRVAV